MFQTSCRENQNTHFVFSIFFPENRAIYEMWKNMRQATDDNVIRRMRIACWIPQAIDMHSEYVLITFSTATMVIRTRLNVTLCVHCLSCFLFILFCVSVM